MVPRFWAPGRSFKGVMTYLTHDVGHAKTNERVDWTHTLNLAADDIDHAVAEMIGTAKHAEVLKAEAGIHGGGTRTEKPVKHLSLNWHPSEKPDKAEMVRASQAFLKHMGWQDHQAILICHNDKPHAHVHLVINAIHPERGTKLDDGLEWRRSEKWALGYELSRGFVFCTQRLLPTEERTPSMPRPAWQWNRDAIDAELSGEERRASFDANYMARLENRRIIEGEEWQLLKDQQRMERTQFFAGGKQAYKAVNHAVYREIRAEMREDWASYYAAKRVGLAFETLQGVRASLIARQKELLEERRKIACGELRAERDLVYRALRDEQKAQRTELIGRQELGLRSPHLLDAKYAGAAAPTPEAEIAKAEDALDRFNVKRGRSNDRSDERREHTSAKQRKSRVAPSPSRSRSLGRGSEGSELRPSRDLASGLAGGLLGFLGALGESMTGPPGKPPPRAREPHVNPLDRFGVKRGRSPPDEAEQKTKREKMEREAWDAWKAKRELDRSRSGW